MHVIAGTLKNRKIKTPKGEQTRPTMGMVREALFNICQTRMAGALFLDLFAGSGAMGIEALSRGAASATFVDSSIESIRCIHENIKLLQLEECAQVLQGDVFQKISFLQKTHKKFDVIYVDPPYENKLEGIQCSHRVLAYLDEGELLAPGGLLFIEGPDPFDLPQTGLKKLQFEKERRMGRTVLKQYTLSE